MARLITPTSLLPVGLSGAKQREKIWLYVGVVVGLLLIAFSMRVYKLGDADLSFDEVATFYVAYRPFVKVIQYVMGAAREHPPTYYLLMTLWMRMAGVSEFAVRFPSVLISVLAVSYSYKLGRRLSGRYGGWWSALLCAIIPFSVWAGRTGRMYALVLLLSLIVMESWLSWLAHPDWQHWLAFVVLSMIGAMTHYYLALLWPAQALVLILLPRKTRTISKPWLLTLVGVAFCVSAFVVISPGIRAMMLEVAKRFPYKGFRGSELRIVFTDLYIWGYRPELSWAGLLGLGFTILGWILIARRDKLTGALFAAWGIVPLVIAHTVPESLETRYLTPMFPALILGLAALLAQLRFSLARILAVGGLLSLAVGRLPIFYDNPDLTFSTRVATLHIAAQPGDALIMNGPWPALLLEYYHPPEFLEVYKVPEKAPPGFSEDVDVARLEEIRDNHDRIWVSYGAIHWADPQYSVSRWLAENTYRVYQRAGIVLYFPDTSDMEEVRVDVVLGSRLRLIKALVNQRQAQIGDFIRIGLDLEGYSLGKTIGITIGLLDAQGNIWQQGDTHFGPVHQPHGTILPDRWREGRGLLLLPGQPPGEYTLALKVEGDGIDAGKVANSQGWIPLSSLTVIPGTTGPDLEPLLPHYASAEVPFDETLTLVGVQPYAANVMQGYPTGFKLWWRVEKPVLATEINTRLVGPEVWESGTFPLAPEFYPSSNWQASDVIQQSTSFQLPDNLPAGTYRVQVQTLSDTGDNTENVWYEIFSFEVEAQKRNYSPPLMRIRQDVRYGDVLRLRGYRLERKNVHPGERVNLTVYWQAVEAPSKIWAVFNHLRNNDSSVIWSGDSWPQAGIYTTDRWQKNEVVAETSTIVIPEDLPPGDYSIYTGVYDPLTGNRLAATTKQGERLLNDEFLLLQLKVRP